MKSFIIILTVFLLQSCSFFSSSSKETKNEYIIERHLFVDVLKDYALAEGAINVNVLNINDNRFDSIYHFDVMKKYGLSKAHYDSTVMYYSSKPNEFKKILEEVLEKLNKEKAQLAQ
jgi:hypothetical protein